MLKLLLGFCLGLYLAIQYPGVLPERLTQLFSAVTTRIRTEAARDPLPSTIRASAPTAEFPVGKNDAPIPPPSPAPVPPSVGDSSSGEGEALRRAQWAEVRNVIEKSREGHP